VTFKIGTQKRSVHAVVTKAVHEMILGIDFLIDADVDWRFSQGKIKLGDEWIQLHKREKSDDVRKVYVCGDCEIPPGVQARVPVEISRPTLNLGLDFCTNDPIEIEERVVVARTLCSRSPLIDRACDKFNWQFVSCAEGAIFRDGLEGRSF